MLGNIFVCSVLTDLCVMSCFISDMYISYIEKLKFSQFVVSESQCVIVFIHSGFWAGQASHCKSVITQSGGNSCAA